MSSKNTRQDFRHAVKNDLSVIIAFAQLLKVTASEEKVVEQLNTIEERARQVLEKIEEYVSVEK